MAAGVAAPMNLHRLLASAREVSASDIHLVVGLPPMLRVDGQVVALKGTPVADDAIAAALAAHLTPDQQERLAREWQLCFSLVFEGSGRARVAVYRRNGRNELSIRLGDASIRSRAELELPEIVDHLARKRHGLVILTGPTGVGKTTTFHYMIDLINSERAAKIITIEDPVEFVHSMKRALIVQQEVLTDVHDFTSALRHVLRQDPDVICIGEMRDRDTIYTALTAAETGHLVIATLHTPGAVDVVQRLVAAFPPGQQEEIRFMLSNSLQGVIAQQLLPRATTEGQVVCCEVMIGTQAVRRQIRENATHQLYSELQAGRKHHMVTMDRSLLDLYQQGKIAYDTAVSMARDPESIKRRAS
jgi:twitching motility protein PilT